MQAMCLIVEAAIIIIFNFYSFITKNIFAVKSYFAIGRV